MGRKITDKIYYPAVISGCVFMMFLLMKDPDGITNAARQGTELCASTMIPTLFPFLAVTSLLLRSGAMGFVGRKLDRVAKLFKTSGDALAIFVLSLFSGFPVGANLTATMTDERKLSKSQSARLMSCCVNAGPAFVIGTVGVEMYRSRRAGIILFVSLTLSAALFFAVSGLFFENEPEIKNKNAVTAGNFSESLVNSVSDAARSMVSVCGWIILFSCLATFIKGKAQITAMFFEVSLGCQYASAYPLPIAALVIGWGGLCVHCQVFRAVIKSGINKTAFFFCRLLNGALSAGICSILLRFFPCAKQTFGSVSENVGVRLYSNAVACVGLLLMCAILIVDFEESRSCEGQSFVKNQKSKKLKNLR